MPNASWEPRLTASTIFCPHSAGFPFLNLGTATARSAPFFPTSSRQKLLESGFDGSPVSTPAKTLARSSSHTSLTNFATANRKASSGERLGSPSSISVGRSGRLYL